jgi:predicted secreted hydrolase
MVAGPMHAATAVGFGPMRGATAAGTPPESRRSQQAPRVSRPARAALPAATAAVAAVAAVLCLLACAPGTPAGAGPAAAPVDVAAALDAADARGYARALAPRPFVFPADHGSHPDFRTEWWYFTGNLAARDGRRFGFQLTFFRVALAPPPLAPATPARASAWATRQVYFAHFALTDVSGRRFRAYERWERQALGLAGAEASPLRIWVGDWSAAAAGPAPAGTPAIRLTAAAPAAPAGAAGAAGGAGGAGGGMPAEDSDGGASCAAVDLLLTTALAPVAQGDRGLSAKGAAPGNASYYYSLPRLSAGGTLRLGTETIPVQGLAWMDREWSTSSLPPGEVGWDWFALQLDDGWEVMLYRLRRRGRGAATPAAPAAPETPETADPASLLTLIAPDGRTSLHPLAAARLDETAHWTNPATGTRYPAGWRLTLPGAGGAPAALDVTVRPLLADQELPLTLRYWEGAVETRGTHAGRPVAGRGYVELTGYAGAEGSRASAPAAAPPAAASR